MNTINLSPKQLRQAANLKEKIARLEKDLAALLGTSPTPPKARHTMSVAGRARVAAAQRARWAKINAAKGQPAAKPARKKISAAGIARIRAVQKARWAKIRAAKPA